MNKSPPSAQQHQSHSPSWYLQYAMACAGPHMSDSGLSLESLCAECCVHLAVVAEGTVVDQYSPPSPAPLRDQLSGHSCCLGGGRRQSGFTELWVSLEERRAGISLCAGNYNLSNVLPNAPDMAHFKQGVRSVAGKLSVFANGVMTSIQVSVCSCELEAVL